MRAIDAALLHEIAQGGRPSLLDALAAELARRLPQAGLDTPMRQAHFLAQACYETWFFSRLEEDLDYSAALSIRDLLDELQRQDIVVIFGRVNPYLRSDMDRHCITPVVGESRIFATLHQAIGAAQGDAPNVPVGA